MIQGLTERDMRGLRFVVEQKAVSYLHLAQHFAPNFEPALDSPPTQDDGGRTKARGGDRRHAPWPRDRKARIHAVSQLVDKWWKSGWVCKERPYLERPQWLWVTEAGLRRLGLEYSDAHFFEEEELNHLYQVTAIRLRLARRPEGAQSTWFAHTWISERAIKASYPQNRPGTVLPHLPDGALELDQDALVKMERGVELPLRRGDRIAIEVELSRKHFQRLEEILPDLLRHYRGVWYFCERKAYDAVVATKQRLVEGGVLTAEQSRLIRVIHLDAEC